MAKFVIVKESPKELEKNCFVIEAPNFLKEIKSCDSKKPKTKVLSSNYLRSLVGAVGDTYADEEFSAITSVTVSKFKGVPCETDEQVENALVALFSRDYPKMFDLYVNHHIKKRPHGTKLIYFLGDFKQSSMFFENGIDQIKIKDVDVYLGNKEKKSVGKPAKTDEEIANNSDNMV